MELIKLTKYSKGSGCGCKIAPDQLKTLLQTNAKEIIDDNLVVGNKENDDAAVYVLDNAHAIISTTDFFTPIVDDAFDFGRIAACNALSDVYAMGGKPMMAIAILGWPIDKIPTSVAQQVLEGARSVCYDAGINLSGGHSIESSEPIFGLAVTGIASVQHIKKNSTAQINDYLFLSKPIGVGILAAAQKRGIIIPNDEQKMMQIMTTLNNLGSALGKIDGVNALTDITGFGLVGHLTEMTKAAGVSANIDLKSIPIIEGINFYTNQFCYPDITTKNLNAYKSLVKGMDGLEFILLCDPQTSGGLLISVNEKALPEFLETCKAYDSFNCLQKPVGRITAKQEHEITIA